MIKQFIQITQDTSLYLTKWCLTWGKQKKGTNLVQFFFALSYFRRNIYAIYLMAYTWNKWYCWFFYHLLQWFPLIGLLYLKWFLISMHVDKFKLNNFHDFTNTYLLSYWSCGEIQITNKKAIGDNYLVLIFRSWLT